MRLVGRALAEYTMIREGDRLLLGLSGGKDSLTLLHVLRAIQRKAPIKFDLACATVDPGVEGFDPASLKDYVPGLGLPHFYRRQAIVERALTTMRGDSFCAYCSRMRRGILYDTARCEGYNVLVLAQHLDDFAESFLMSAFHGGSLRTMKAHYVNDAGDVRVIRTLLYVRERVTIAFAAHARLPVIADNCPACFRMPTRRAHFKALLAAEEQTHPRLFANLLATMRPLFGSDTPYAGSEARAPVRRAS